MQWIPLQKWPEMTHRSELTFWKQGGQFLFYLFWGLKEQVSHGQGAGLAINCKEAGSKSNTWISVSEGHLFSLSTSLVPRLYSLRNVKSKHFPFLSSSFLPWPHTKLRKNHSMKWVSHWTLGNVTPAGVLLHVAAFCTWTCDAFYTLFAKSHDFKPGWKNL